MARRDCRPPSRNQTSKKAGPKPNSRTRKPETPARSPRIAAPPPPQQGALDLPTYRVRVAGMIIAIGTLLVSAIGSIILPVLLTNGARQPPTPPQPTVITIVVTPPPPAAPLLHSCAAVTACARSGGQRAATPSQTRKAAAQRKKPPARADPCGPAAPKGLLEPLPASPLTGSGWPPIFG